MKRSRGFEWMDRDIIPESRQSNKHMEDRDNLATRQLNVLMECVGGMNKDYQDLWIQLRESEIERKRLEQEVVSLTATLAKELWVRMRLGKGEE